MNQKLDQWLSQVPVVAIIRGVTPDEVVDIGTALFESGIGVIEVPLNSPDPFTSIARLSDSLGQQCVIGCGTLVRKSDVKKVADAGGEIAVTPSTRPGIIRRCIKHNMTPVPGWATPSEAFAAYQAGARYLKLFPASTYGPGHIKAVRAVLPGDARIMAVGGVGPDVAADWLTAGIDGFGIGSELYKPGFTADEVAQRACAVVQAIQEAG